MAKIGILIDSASTYDEEFIRANDIQKIPLNFTNSKGESVSDNGTLNATDIFQEIKTTKILWKTASSILGDLMDKVDEMLQTYDKVIFVPVSWQLSSQYNSATILLSEFPNRFFIVKTNKAVYENELLYKKLVELINSGMDAEEAIDGALKSLENSITIFSTMDNSGLVKSGRASKALIKAISLLKVKPIVEQYGKNHMVGFSTSFKGALKNMGKYAKERFNVKSFDGLVNSVCILETFGQTEEQKTALIQWCKEILKVDDSKIFTRWLPLPVQVHTFPGSYGFCIECSIPNTGNKWTKDSDDE